MGALLRGVKREQIRRGQVLVAPGSIKAVKKFRAQIYVGETDCSSLTTKNTHFPQIQVLTKDEGN
jgi:elongation factor Tu